MADIIKCANWFDCPRHENCYRHTAKPRDLYWTSWADFHPESPWLCFYKREAEQEEEVKK